MRSACRCMSARAPTAHACRQTLPTALHAPHWAHTQLERCVVGASCSWCCARLVTVALCFELPTQKYGTFCLCGRGEFDQAGMFTTAHYCPHQITRHYAKVQAPASKGSSRVPKGVRKTVPRHFFVFAAAVVGQQGWQSVHDAVC
jgi:hypothetical protein